MVKNIMDKPILGIPIKSKTLKIPFIKTPRTLAIGPKISPSYWLKTIPVNLFPPVFDFINPIGIMVQGHILLLKRDCIL